MGSDSRTATASSKTRPSWRDRHLSQLSDEQLDEVKHHRGSESVSSMSGIESDGAAKTAPSTAPKEASSAPPPRPQAGPALEDRSHRSDQDQHHLRLDEQPDHASDVARYRDRNQEHRNDAEHRRADAYPPGADSQGDLAARAQSVHRPEQLPRQQQERRPEQGRYEPSGRYASDEQYENRHDTRANYQTESIDPRAGAPVTTKPANKKGFVDRVLDFQMPAPLKYSLMALAIAVMVAVALLKPIDNSSQSQLESAFIRASIGFGIARALNGVISVAQGTEFAVQPAGVGVNFSPGEILDPINDLVERFSWIMLLATSSIGIQQILLQISSWTGITVLLGGAGLFFLLTRMRNSSFSRMADIAGKLLLAMLLVRFLVPVGSLANDWVYKQFLQPQYEESAAELEVASERIKEISTRQAEAQESDGSISDRAKKLYSSMTSKFDFDGMLDDYKQSAETVSENAISLIVVFVLQTIIFPLLFMYLIYRLFRSVLLPSRRPQ